MTNTEKELIAQQVSKLQTYALLGVIDLTTRYAIRDIARSITDTLYPEQDPSTKSDVKKPMKPNLPKKLGDTIFKDVPTREQKILTTEQMVDDFNSGRMPRSWS